jgi:hypothetical protein
MIGQHKNLYFNFYVRDLTAIVKNFSYKIFFYNFMYKIDFILRKKPIEKASKQLILKRNAEEQ